MSRPNDWPVTEELEHLQSLLEDLRRGQRGARKRKRKRAGHPGSFTGGASGRRLRRSTKRDDEAIAIQMAAQFEQEYQRRRAGLATFDAFKKWMAPAIEHWVSSSSATEQACSSSAGVACRRRRTQGPRKQRPTDHRPRILARDL